MAFGRALASGRTLRGTEAALAERLRQHEGTRRKIVGLIVAFFLLLPLEGVFRKWLLNDIEQPLVLIRDPVMIAILILYLLYRGNTIPRWFGWWYVVVVAAMLIAIAQSMTTTAPPLTLLIGLRNYLLFVPLAFIMYDVLDAQDIRRLLVLCLWISIPIAALVIVQFFSPVASPVNKGLTDDVVGRFTVVENIVRPYGPFTFVLGQAVFAGFAFALILSCWLIRRPLRLPMSLLAVATASCAAMGALSGTRTFFVSAIITAFFYLVAALMSRRAREAVGKLAIGLVAVAAFLITFIVIFPESFEAMTQRQEDAVRAEGSTGGRAFFIIVEFISFLEKAPALGYGIGAGSNAGGYVASGSREFQLAEYEWTRVILEMGPIFGILIILARVGVTVWAARLAIHSVRFRDNNSGMVSLGFIAPLLVAGGQVSGQNTMVSFSWFALGLTLSLTRLDLTRTNAA